MRKTIVKCDRCSTIILYDEKKDKLIDGVIFMVPVNLSNGNTITDFKQIELCSRCTIELKEFMSNGKF